MYVVPAFKVDSQTPANFGTDQSPRRSWSRDTLPEVRKDSRGFHEVILNNVIKGHRDLLPAATWTSRFASAV